MTRPTSSSSSSLAGLAALATLAACVEPAAESPLGTSEHALIECTEWQCGSNSPVIDTYRFHELNVNGIPNAQGFQVIGMYKGSTPFTLSVDRGRILGKNGAITLQGLALKDAQIRLRRLTRTYAIRIADVQSTTMFARLDGAPRQIETYRLDVGELVGGGTQGDWVNVCSNPPSYDNPDVQSMNVFHSVVFEGERIDAKRKTIGTALDPSWFNIGCAGHALAKLALGGHTEAAHQTHGFATTIPERQAYLKMVSGDYCGTGKPFTVAGQPLQWMDAHLYTKYQVPLQDLELEARWTAAGAQCLNTPRVDAHPTADGLAVWNGMVSAAIAAECGSRPPCLFGAGTFDNRYLLSANPL